MTPEAEKFNGWMAMIGFVAATGAYITTGQIIPVYSNESITSIRPSSKSKRKVYNGSLLDWTRSLH